MTFEVSAAFEIRDDAALHLFRRQPVVLPDDADDRDVDVGKDVDRHGDDREPPEMAMSSAMTTNVYGRRSASLTIHMVHPRIRAIRVPHSLCEKPAADLAPAAPARTTGQGVK